MTIEEYYKLKDRQKELEILATTATPEDMLKIEKEYKDIYLSIKVANRTATLNKKHDVI
jgi:hypothetical protein